MVDDSQLCVVSLQRPGVPDPAEAHLGPGLLVGPSLVLVSAETLLAAPARFDVLIGPVPGGSGPVELHAAHPFPDGRVSIARMKGYEDSIALGHVQLVDGRSSYPGRDARLDLLQKAVTTRRLAAILPKPGGPWGALSAMVPDETRELPDAEWFATMREQISPAGPPVDLIVPEADFGRFLCRLSPAWDPGGGLTGLPGEQGKVAPGGD